MSAVAGTGPLVKLAARRDRILLPAWIYVLTAVVASTAYSLKKGYPTAADRAALAAGVGHNPSIAAIYGAAYSSSLGGIVAWRACLDQPSRLAENVEVYASHFGIGNHPAALWVIADRLTQAPGTWAPFRPPARWRCAYPTPISTDPVDPS